MNERPILFSGDMVRALLRGSKTQTRRIVKLPDAEVPVSINQDGGGNWIAWYSDRARRTPEQYAEDTKQLYPNGEGFPCPYGKPGDRLWVRETWNALYDVPGDEMPWYHHELSYFSDDPKARAKLGRRYFYRTDDPSHIPTKDDIEIGFKWQPSIFMPRAASRLSLEITHVRVERLQDISEVDAIDEGMAGLSEEWLAKHFPEWHRERQPILAANAALTAAGQRMGLTRPPIGPSPRRRFIKLWDALNAKRGYSWESNPWVFVVEFKRVES